jgi:hypothetical protein
VGTGRGDRDDTADARVGWEDVGHLQRCLSGSGEPQTDPTCRDAMLDDDTDVDQSDVTVMLKCMRGPGVIADPSCAR